MENRAQGAIELLVLWAFAIMFFIIIMFAVNDNIYSQNQKEDLLNIDNLATTTSQEFMLAAAASEGYQRNFNIPQTMYGRNYTIATNDNFLMIQLGKEAASYPIPQINGTIKKGANILRKANGQIYLN